MLVTRGLGGYALVTVGLGDLGSPAIEGIVFFEPGEWHSAQFAAGAARTRPRDAAQRITLRDTRKARHRRSGGV